MGDPETPPEAKQEIQPAVPPTKPVRAGARQSGKRAAHAKAAEQPPSAPQTIWGTGRRKEAIARVRLLPGTGQILVNKRTYESYFPRETLRFAIRQPLVVTHQLGKCDVRASVEGGGLSGQAGALRLGIARALLRSDPALRPNLRGAGFLRRDPRTRERKKYGRKGARKRFQWTKR